MGFRQEARGLGQAHAWSPSSQSRLGPKSHAGHSKGRAVSRWPPPGPGGATTSHSCVGPFGDTGRPHPHHSETRDRLSVFPEACVTLLQDRECV